MTIILIVATHLKIFTILNLGFCNFLFIKNQSALTNEYIFTCNTNKTPPSRIENRESCNEIQQLLIPSIDYLPIADSADLLQKECKQKNISTNMTHPHSYRELIILKL